MTDRILIVDDDSETRSLLRELALATTDATVAEAPDGANALLMLREHAPDMILLDLDMPGLSGPDMLIALQAHGYRGPLIALAGGEQSVLEAFRLGATDFVLKPLREAEVVTAITRGLENLRRSRRADQLSADLKAAQARIEAQSRELAALSAIGELVAQVRDLKNLFDRVLDAVIDLTGADHALLMLRDDISGKLVLRAGKNLPLALLDRLGEPVDDRLADLVITSREALIMAGDSLRRFAVTKEVHAVAYVPLTVQSTAIGVLAASSDTAGTAFDQMHGRALKTLANYAAIALVNARLFAMLDRRASRLTPAPEAGPAASDAAQRRQIQALQVHLKQPLDAVEMELGRLIEGGEGPLADSLARRLTGIQRQVRHLQALVGNLTSRPE